MLTLTADEAIGKHFAEGKASSVEEVLSSAGVEDYELIRYEPTLLDRILGWLMNPFAQGLFVMLIVGGIYFEVAIARNKRLPVGCSGVGGSALFLAVVFRRDGTELGADSVCHWRTVDRGRDLCAAPDSELPAFWELFPLLSA